MLNITDAALKVILQSPWGLFVLMLLASFSNGLKQIAVVRQTGPSMTCWDFFVKYGTESTGMLVTNIVAFVVLVLTDQLNFASALGVGYGVNSVMDLLPGSKRSYALKATPDDPAKLTPAPPQQGK
jgi:hypothetical protein